MPRTAFSHSPSRSFAIRQCKDSHTEQNIWHRQRGPAHHHSTVSQSYYHFIISLHRFRFAYISRYRIWSMDWLFYFGFDQRRIQCDWLTEIFEFDLPCVCAHTNSKMDFKWTKVGKRKREANLQHTKSSDTDKVEKHRDRERTKAEINIELCKWRDFHFDSSLEARSSSYSSSTYAISVTYCKRNGSD